MLDPEEHGTIDGRVHCDPLKDADFTCWYILSVGNRMVSTRVV